MKRFGLLVLALALLVVVAVGLLVGPLRDRWQEPLRALVEREIGLALHTPCTLEELSISWAPLQIEVRGLRLGADGEVGTLASARIDVHPRTSLRQRRPVVDIDAEQVTLDLPRLLDAIPPSPKPSTPTPPFRLRRVHVRDARVVIADISPPLVVSAPTVDGEVGADGFFGRLRFAGRVEPVTLERGERHLTLASVSARGGETPSGWRLAHVDLSGEGIQLTGAERDDALQLDGELELTRLVVVDDDLGALHGSAHIVGALEGALDEPRLRATVTVPALTIGEQVLGQVSATAQLERSGVTVSSANLRGFGGTAEGKGTLKFDDPLTSTARLSWNGLALRELVTGDDIPAATLTGEADVTGTLDPLRVEGTASGQIVVAGGAPPLQWKGNGRYASGGGNAVVEVAQGNGNTAGADLALAADGGIAGTVRLRVADPDALATLVKIQSLPELRGALDANATVSGTIRDPRFEGALSGRQLSVVGVRVDSIDGRFAGDRHAVRSEGIRGALGGGTLTATGTVALDRAGDNAGSIKASAIDGGAVTALLNGLAGVRPPIAGGRVTLDAAATGPWSRVRLNGTARIDDFWLGRERIAELVADVRAADGAWSADAHLRNRIRQEVTLRATGRGAEDLVIALDCQAWTLTSLWHGEEASMGGTVRASATLRGPARALSGTATVAADDLVLGGRAFKTVRVDVSADRGRWRATTAVLDDTLQLAAEVRPDPGFPFTLDATWTQADFARLVGAQHDLQVPSSGRLRATGRLDAIDQLEARADVSSLEVTGGVQPVIADVPLTILCRRGVCVIDRLTLRSGDNSLRINGEAGFDGRVRLTITGGGTLGLLEIIGEPIESARGQFTVDATVSHDGGGWAALGTLNLTQVGIDAGLAVAITRANGRLVFDGAVVRVENLSGRIGSGTFTIGGQVDLRSGPALLWTLKDVGADPLPSLEVELGGRGTLEGAWKQLRLTGDVRVNRMLYDRNIELTDFLPRFNRALAPAPRPEGSTDVELALMIDAPGELFVENNLTRLEARARLSLTGTAYHPVLDGRIEALDGEIYLRGRTFDLLGATADFRPDLGNAAALNISAESLIDTPDASYVVGVRVTGTTLDPRVTLSSDDPSLTQNDIATLIAFGRTTAQMRQEGGSFSLSGAFGSGIGNLLSGEAEKVLPVDRIDFEPTFSTTTGAFEPQLTLGKDITQDLAASIGQTFGVSSRTRVELTYRLGPHVWALGSWESQTQTEAGAWAGGLRTRYDWWRLTPYTLLGGLQ